MKGDSIASIMNYRFAGLFIRCIAFFLDVFIIFSISTLALILFPENQTGLAGIFLLVNYVFFFFYTLFFWENFSTTPGKMILGLKIVQYDNCNMSTIASIHRLIGYHVSFIMFFSGFLMIHFDRRNQGFHDKLAKTYVVTER